MLGFFSGNDYFNSTITTPGESYVDATPEDGICDGDVATKQNIHNLAPYQPQLLVTENTIGGSVTCIPNRITGGNADQPVNITVSLPSYIGGRDNVTKVVAKFFDEDGVELLNDCGSNLQDDCGYHMAKDGAFDLSGATYPATTYPDCENGAAANAYPFASFFDSQGDNGGMYESAGDNVANATAAFCIHADSTERDVLKISFGKYRSFPYSLDIRQLQNRIRRIRTLKLHINPRKRPTRNAPWKRPLLLK